MPGSITRLDKGKTSELLCPSFMWLRVRRGVPGRAGPSWGMKTHARRILRNRDERTWAWSGGGPGRNSGEHSALKSIFGTVVQSRSPGGQWSGHLPRLKRGELPMKPWFGRARSGGAISRVIPHTTEVLPSLTRADDGAVETEPARRGDERSTHHPVRGLREERLTHLCLR